MRWHSPSMLVLLLVACSSNRARQATDPADASGSIGASNDTDGSTPATQTRTLIVTMEGAGRVVSSGGEVDCTGPCTRFLDDGAHVVLTASSAPGWGFSGWTTPCSGTSSCELTLAADVAVGARFVAAPPAPPSTHTVRVQVVGGGRVETSTLPFGVWCPTICSATFGAGTTVTLQAMTFTDWHFRGWTGACSGAGACTLPMTADAEVTATFDQIVDGECSGLTPLDPGPPRILSVPVDPNFRASCFGGFTDGSGSVFVGTSGDKIATRYSFFAADGTARATRDAGNLSSVYPQRDGFLAFAAESAGYGIYALDHDGATKQHLSFSSAAIIEAGAMGAGMAVSTASTIDAFDEHGNPRWSVSIADITEKQKVLGVDSLGNVLLLFDGSVRFPGLAFAGLWVTKDGQRGDPFPTHAPNYGDTWVGLYPRIGGGFWEIEFSPLGQQGTFELPPPGGTSSARVHWTPRLANGGRAYALLPDEIGAWSPICELEVTTPAGTSCGTLTFDDPSGQCSSDVELTIGLDGTLLQRINLPYHGDCSSGCSCTWRVWDQYLR